LTTLKSLVRGALTRLGWARASASVVLADDALLRSLNRDFRDIDRATDVLSFPMADLAGDGGAAGAERGAERVFLGEIYVSLETARRQARRARRPFAREVAHLVLHGLLHLVGYDHRTGAERRRMSRLEAELMRGLRAEIEVL
jgi:probable rRNA maturation factor